jgi:hypothetical protein
MSREDILITLGGSPDHYPQKLEEQFPHILEKIVNLWKSPECGVYLADLLQPEGRGGGRFDRSGFPDEIWEELLYLNQLHLNAMN